MTQEPVRFIARPVHLAAQDAGFARVGPFRVLDGNRAALVAATDAASPQAFASMLASYPGLEVSELADASGTSNDLANLRVGRAIRAAGLATHVSEGRSARLGCSWPAPAPPLRPARWIAPETAAPRMAPKLAPSPAYADPSAGLLDSMSAFP